MTPHRTIVPVAVIAFQDRLIQLLGSSVEGRAALVAGMLRRSATEATSYWLQLAISIGIATLGLVLGSTAVVIGAMLVAPLLGPIIGLAMGLATASPFLVIRSVGRIAISVVIAMCGAAAITLLLPFRELNPEIAARTSPTVLDLITAGFCALAGVYASLRPGSDTATTAAGTSISISLVPPLCASGYGVGTHLPSVVWGALLLFLTNLVAIVVVGTIVFLAAGFSRVDVASLERDALLGADEAPVARALANRLALLFDSRGGPVLRFMMPFALLAAVYAPLRHALDEVGWQVRVRQRVLDAIAREPLPIVQSRVRVERHEVEIVLVLLGKSADADAARARLDGALRKSAGVVPRIEVFAVPDATAFAGLESTLLTPQTAAKATTTTLSPTPSEQLETVRTRLLTVVRGLWPTHTVGAPLSIELGMEGPLTVRIVHVGRALGPVGVEALQKALAAGLAQPVILREVAVPPEPLTRSESDLSLVTRVVEALRVTRDLEMVRLCVTRPAETGRKRPSQADTALKQSFEQLLAEYPRVAFRAGDDWTFQFTTSPCAAASTREDAEPARP